MEMMETGGVPALIRTITFRFELVSMSRVEIPKVLKLIGLTLNLVDFLIGHLNSKFKEFKIV